MEQFCALDGYFYKYALLFPLVNRSVLPENAPATRQVAGKTVETGCSGTKMDKTPR
jgi:hypothetical protein